MPYFVAPIAQTILSKLVKEQKSHMKLVSEIDAIDKKISIPFSEKAKGMERYRLLLTIEELELRLKLESCKNSSEEFALAEAFILKWRKLIHMHGEELRKQAATKEDIALIGLSIQEFTSLLDKKISEFRNDINIFEIRSKTKLSEYEAKVSNSEQDLKLQLDVLRKSHSLFVQNLNQELDVITSQTKAVFFELENQLNISREGLKAELVKMYYSVQENTAYELAKLRRRQMIFLGVFLALFTFSFSFQLLSLQNNLNQDQDSTEVIRMPFG
jgi:hypothetical protein